MHCKVPVAAGARTKREAAARWARAGQHAAVKAHHAKHHEKDAKEGARAAHLGDVFHLFEPTPLIAWLRTAAR